MQTSIRASRASLISPWDQPQARGKQMARAPIPSQAMATCCLPGRMSRTSRQQARECHGISAFFEHVPYIVLDTPRWVSYPHLIHNVSTFPLRHPVDGTTSTTTFIVDWKGNLQWL